MNLELLAEAIAWAEANPDTWNQAAWVQVTNRGVQFGIDGYIACLKGGATPIFFDGKKHTSRCGVVHHSGGVEYEEIDVVAWEALQIPRIDADILFHADNTLGDLKCCLEDLKEYGFIRDKSWAF